MGLSHKDATIIMGMLARGDKNHDIAAWFGENPARVAEVKDGTAFGEVPPAPHAELPPETYARGCFTSGPTVFRCLAITNGR